MMTLANNTADRTSEFVRLFAEHNRTVYKHILTLLGNAEAAQEVFQETSVVLWEKFSEFSPDTHFSAWACRIAYFEVLKFRQTVGREHLLFNDTLVHALAQQREEDSDLLEERRKALRQCLKKLRSKDQELIDQCYSGGVTIQHIANMTGRPVNTLYKALGRIRRSLFHCVNRVLESG